MNSKTFEETEVLARRRGHIDALWGERGCLDGETAEDGRRRHLVVPTYRTVNQVTEVAVLLST